jgi:hypothetical protein
MGSLNAILNRVHFFVYQQTGYVSFQTAINAPFEISLHTKIVTRRLLGNDAFGSHGQINLSKIVKQPAIFGYR